MWATANRPAPLGIPAEKSELLGRIMVSVAMATMASGLLQITLLNLGSDAGPQFWIFPRLFTFALATAIASAIQGGQPGSRFLIWGFLVSLGFTIIFHSQLVDSHRGLEPWGPQSVPIEMSSCWGLFLFQSEVLMAVFLGTLFARPLDQGGQLLGIILCASVGDAWITILQVTETIGPQHPIRLLRPPWPTTQFGLMAAPAFADILLLALLMEAGTRLRLKTKSVILGALIGFLAAVLLSATMFRVRFSIPLISLGVLLATWSRFRCTARQVAGAFGLAVALFILLLGLSKVRGWLHPEPPHPPPLFQLRDIA